MLGEIFSFRSEKRMIVALGEFSPLIGVVEQERVWILAKLSEQLK